MTDQANPMPAAFAPPVVRSHVVGLDHLRAFAAFLVFYWHGIHLRGIGTEYVPGNALASIFEEGWIGVSAFMCVTGFVFSVITDGKDINYLGFMKNRFLRLFPLIFIVTLFAAPNKNATPDAMVLFFNLLGSGTVYGTWSLVVEFQFYLAYPFFRDHLVSKALGPTIARCLLLVGFFLFFRAAQFAIAGTVQEIVYWTMFGRADEFLFGIIAAQLYLRSRHDINRRVRTLAWIGLVGCSAALVGFWHYFNLRGGYYHQPVYPSTTTIWIVLPLILGPLWATVVLCYCLLAQGWTGRMSRAIGYLGAISYSTYMLQFLSLPLVDYIYKGWLNWHFSGDSFVNSTILLLLLHYPVTLLISTISYELVEKTFIRRKTPYLTRRVA